MKVETESAKLINGINSYQSIENYKAFINDGSQDWEDSGGTKLDPGDKRPPFDMHEITIKNYSHLGYGGELHISFFNNRLMDTRFYPQDFDRYVESLKKVDGIKFDINKEANILPFTDIWIATDHKQREYVGWKDTRLEKEMKIWISRYS